MEFDLDKWKEKYRTEEIVNIKEEFTIEEFQEALFSFAKRSKNWSEIEEKLKD